MAESVWHLTAYESRTWQTRAQIVVYFSQGIHLGKPDNCPDFMYALMKDCWQKEPEKRLEFTTISMRLKYPYHNYDVPPASELVQGAEEPEDKEAAEPGTCSRECVFWKVQL